MAWNIVLSPIPIACDIDHSENAILLNTAKFTKSNRRDIYFSIIEIENPAIFMVKYLRCKPQIFGARQLIFSENRTDLNV